MQSRWMLTLQCEQCGGIIKRAIQDVVALKIGKHNDKCPHCGAPITLEKGLTPQDLEKL